MSCHHFFILKLPTREVGGNHPACCAVRGHCSFCTLLHLIWQYKSVRDKVKCQHTTGRAEIMRDELETDRMFGKNERDKEGLKYLLFTKGFAS